MKFFWLGGPILSLCLSLVVQSLTALSINVLLNQLVYHGLHFCFLVVGLRVVYIIRLLILLRRVDLGTL
jgi:hypothetical protein